MYLSEATLQPQTLIRSGKGLTTAYAYELLLHYDMLLEPSGTMPKEATASSMGAANPTSRPACRKKNNTHSLTMSKALHRLGNAPLRIERSPEEPSAARRSRVGRS